MLRELLSHIDHRIFPHPSEEFSQFVARARWGENKELPSFGKEALFDYYGKNKDWEEQGRYRIPMGSVERNFHVQQKANGTFKVTDEGLFPYDGK